MPIPRIIFLVGPTAIGKSEIAALLAKKMKAEIISCDSIQVYKGMPIITSKPPSSILKKAPHNLISVIPAAKEYNVSQYRKEALEKAKDIIKRKNIPFFVGGTGLYMSILVDGIFEQDAQDELIRKKLYEVMRKKGSAYLYKELEKIDPLSAAKIHPNDAKRLIRALEVFKATGQTISALQKLRRGLKDEYSVKIFCLNMDRNKLYKRIDSRVDKMFELGLIKEVKRLLKIRLSKTASCAIGIKELKGYFDGVYDLEEAKRLMKRNTRHYAKRQLTWFRKDNRIEWINIKDNDKSKEVAGRLWKKLKKIRKKLS